MASKSEQKIQQEIRLEASKLGLVLFRNNTGSLQAKNGRWVQFGLCKGSSDLIGWRVSDGKFVALEVKRPGKSPTKEQTNFIDNVLSAGGIAGVVTSIEDLKNLLTLH